MPSMRFIPHICCSLHYVLNYDSRQEKDLAAVLWGILWGNLRGTLIKKVRAQPMELDSI